jgi:hypothetical protein
MEIVLIVVNILLVIVTWYYACHTNRMANVMYKDYELRTTPLADIQLKITLVLKPQIRFSVIVTNKGYCRIRVTSGQWRWWSKKSKETRQWLYTWSPPYVWLSAGQQYCFDCAMINLPENYWTQEFDPFWHIAVDGWVECESPVGTVKRYEIKTNI